MVFFNFGDTLRKKTSKPKIRAEILDDWEDVEGIVHFHGLSYVPKIIRIELNSHFGIEISRTCCQKILVVVATKT